LNADGTFDQNFNSEGKLFITKYQDPANIKLGLLSTGSFIIAGTATKVNEEGSTLFIEKVNPDGSIDSSFNIKEIEELQKGAFNSSISILEMKILHDDEIILAGIFGIKSYEFNYQIIKLNVDGSLNNGFGNNGIINYVGGYGLHGIAFQPDGEIITFSLDSLARFNIDGSLDTDFGNGGYIPTNPVYMLQVQADNKLLMINQFGDLSRYFNDQEYSISNFKITKFTLINAINNEELMVLDTGNVNVIDLLALGTNEINIRAYTDPEVIGSIKFNLMGDYTLSRIENTEPYALFRNDGENFFNWHPNAGYYHFVALPYTEADGKGDVKVPSSVSFSIISNVPRIEKLMLINANKDSEIFEIVYDNNIINLNEISTSEINIRILILKLQVV
jgi:uncharacterized delta-60 repeat protein